MYTIDNLFNVYPILEQIKKEIITTCEILKTAFKNDNTLFVCGNGGSAADAEHIAGELLKGFLKPRKVPSKFCDKLVRLYKEDGEILAQSLQQGLRTVSLNSHPSLTTAFANDVHPVLAFAQQLYVLGRERDVVLGISTSGNAKNIYHAFQVAKAKDIKTILLTGKNQGICEKFADVAIKVPETETYRIQEYHLPIYHAICAELEEYFYG